MGSLHRLRDTIEQGRLRPLEILKRNRAATTCAFQVGATKLSLAVLRAHIGRDLPQANDPIRFIDDST